VTKGDRHSRQRAGLNHRPVWKPASRRCMMPRTVTAGGHCVEEDSEGMPLVSRASAVFVTLALVVGMSIIASRTASAAPPPDTTGAVGATQYVQWVNESFAVFDKATGALLSGPKAGNSAWVGFGGGCETNNDGDPIVQYDKQANRWILTQFSVSTTPFLQCVAVSTTSDATGSYNRYAFNYGNQLPDYPKLGVWPDAYYVTYNIFTNGQTVAGPKVCAWDRAAMLAGASATQVCFQLGTAVHSLLPSDLDGTTAPPAGAPN